MATSDAAKQAAEYWSSRALEDEALAQRTAEETSARIRQLYQTQYKKIAKQMELLYAEVQDGKAIGRTKLWNYSRWREMEAMLSQFIKGGSLIEQEKIRGCLDKVFADVIGVLPEALSAENFTLRPDPASVINTAWSGEKYSARVWKNRTALAERIRIDMEDMIVQGKGLSEMRRQLMREFSTGYSQADRLLRTETSYVFNRASLMRYSKAGVKKVEWIAGIHDNRECDICGGRDGKVFLLTDAPVMPAHPNCRCVWSGVVELEGEDVPLTGPEALARE